MSSRWNALLGAALLLVCVPGCGDDDAPQQAEGQTARRKPKKKAKKPEPVATPTPEPVVEYTYNPVGKRDPFKSFIKTDTVEIERKLTTPLQKYDLDQYRVVGIVWGAAEPLAMVEDPEGNGHFLRQGTLIGKNWGKVARINPGGIVVAEEYRDIQGQLNVNEIVMDLPVE